MSSIVAGSQKVPHENRVRPTVKLLSAYFSFELSYPLPLPRPALRVETVRRWLTTTLHLWQPYQNLVSFSLKAQSVQILGPTSTHRTKCWLWEHYSPAGLATRGWPPKKLTFGNLKSTREKHTHFAQSVQRKKFTRAQHFLKRLGGGTCICGHVESVWLCIF